MDEIRAGNVKVSIKIQQVKDDKVYEMTSKESLTLQRSPNEPSVLSVSLLRDNVSAEEGDRITVTLNDNEKWFSGRIRVIDKEEKWASVVAYDQLFQITKNMNWFIYEHQTANKVFYSICDTCRLENAEEDNMSDTGYVIPYRVERGKSGLDVIQTALDLTYENTGKKYYVWDDFGSPCLSSEESLARQVKTKIRTGMIDSYRYREDGTEHYTAAEAFCETDVAEDLPKTNANPDEDPYNPDEEKKDQNAQRTSFSTIAEDLPSTGVGDAGQGEEDPDKEEYEKALKSVINRYTEFDEEAIDDYGFLKFDGTYEEGENGAYKAKQFLKEHSDADRTLTISKALGDPNVRGGTPLLVDFFSKDRQEFLRGWFSVEQVTHTIDRGFHTMDLTLKNIIMFKDWNDDEPDMSFKRPESEKEEEPEEEENNE